MKNAILKTLAEGGATLWALLLLAVMIYGLVFGIWWYGRRSRARVRRGEWQGDAASMESTSGAGDLELRAATFELDEMAWVERRLPFLGVLIGAAPLLGLLGTVAGMLVTFSGMASSSGAEPIDTISSGISKALVTTQAGLVIAVPASFLFALLKRQTESTHLELQRQLHEALSRDVPAERGLA